MRLIDAMHLGRQRVIGVLAGRRRAGRPGPDSCLPDAARARSATARPRALLLTHIHLDHAGASGSLVRALARPRGLRARARRARTWPLPSGCSRARGGCTARTWTACGARWCRCPRRTCACSSGGERILDGRFEVAYTPGHASHHVSYLHDGTAFVGDVGGVRITPLVARRSRRRRRRTSTSRRGTSRSSRSRAWRPRAPGDDPFRRSEDVEAQLDEVGRRLDEWAELARELDRGRIHRHRRIGRSRRRRGRRARPRLHPGRAARAAVRRPAPLLAQARGVRIASTRRGYPERSHVADGRVAASSAVRQRSRRPLARRRSQRRLQHVRPRRRDARQRDPGRHPRRGLPLRRPDPQLGLRDRLERCRARTPSCTGSSSTAPG